jgi:hypothetical protein
VQIANVDLAAGREKAAEHAKKVTNCEVQEKYKDKCN